jgi:hypothetical protein
VGESTSIHVVLCKLGQLDEDRHHDRREEVGQVDEVSAGILVWRGLPRFPVILRLLEEVLDLARDVGDDAVLSELQRLLERGEGLEVNRPSSLSRSVICISTVERE